MAAAKKKTTKGTVAAIYHKAKEVVGDLLTGAAKGAVSGAADSAEKAVGIKKPADLTGTGDGKGLKTKVTAKSASASRPSAAKPGKKAPAAAKAPTKSTKKAAASTKPAAKATAKKTAKPKPAK